MKKYIVHILTSTDQLEIEAESKKEAIKKVYEESLYLDILSKQCEIYRIEAEELSEEEEE